MHHSRGTLVSIGAACAIVGALAPAGGCSERRGADAPPFARAEQVSTGARAPQAEEPAPMNQDEPLADGEKEAMFGAGCFWGAELAFSKIPGVTGTAVGFSGGRVENPSYKQVCFADTGHAEVVRVRYDPDRVSYRELVDRFWTMHDPTQLNRQGPDVGEQYRSVIFVYDEAQREQAEASVHALEESGRFDRPIVTKIEPAGAFYRAEEYHQKYLEKRGIESCTLPGG